MSSRTTGFFEQDQKRKVSLQTSCMRRVDAMSVTMLV
jgi:hypothetical protein